MALDDNYAAQLSSSLDEALKHLQNGEAIIFPTDTVCGIGVSIAHCNSPDILFKLKGRSSSKPIQWLVGSKDDLFVYGKDVSQAASALSDKFWPGALTIVVRASDAVPLQFQSKDGTIGLRMPSDSEVLRLIEMLGCPIASTSANKSGHSPASSLEQLDKEWLLSTGCFVLSGKSEGVDGSKGSTVIDCVSDTPRVLRRGSVVIQ